MRREDSKWWSAGFTREWWDGLGKVDRAIFLDTLTDEELISFHSDWRVWARDKQLLPDGKWDVVMALCGRGFGKTRMAVENIHDAVEQGTATSIAIVGQGEADIRRVMIEGRSGFLRCAKPGNVPRWSPSIGGGGELHWPTGAVGYVYSAMDPESLRGPEFDFAWFDEPMAVPAEKRAQSVYNLTMALRAGEHPRLLYTTTPRPHRWLHEQLALAKRDADLPLEERRYVVITGSTFENERNLAPAYIRAMRDTYDGTSQGRQELYAEILGDEAGAMWTPQMLDATRLLNRSPNDPTGELYRLELAGTCEKVIVAVDPNMVAGAATHAAGIVVCGKRGIRRFVLDDFSVQGQSPAKWAARALLAAQRYNATEIVCEVNQGGDLVKTVIDQVGADMIRAGTLRAVPTVIKVRATKGKLKRAEPVALLYERKLVSHAGAVGTAEKPGVFYKLENQLCAMHDSFDPTGEDFDRADALVWGMTRLGLKGDSTSGSTAGSGGMGTFGEFDEAA